MAPTCTLNTGDIWCGVVTVGELPGAYGYNESQGVGHLSDTDFDVGTNSYTIAVLSVTKQGLPEGSGSGSLTLSIEPRPGAAEHEEILGMELHVNSDRFNLSDVVEGGRGYYYWLGSVANLDWSGEDYIIARLREASSPGQVAEPLTAEFQGLPEAHDGETPFTFRIVYSEAVSVTPEAMRTRVLTVEGRAVSRRGPRRRGERRMGDHSHAGHPRGAVALSAPGGGLRGGRGGLHIGRPSPVHRRGAHRRRPGSRHGACAADGDVPGERLRVGTAQGTKRPTAGGGGVQRTGGSVRGGHAIGVGDRRVGG